MKRLKGKVKRKRLKQPKNIIDTDLIEVEDISREIPDRSDVIVSILMGILLGYSIIALGKLGALLAFSIAAVYIIKEVVLK